LWALSRYKYLIMICYSIGILFTRFLSWTGLKLITTELKPIMTEASARSKLDDCKLYLEQAEFSVKDKRRKSIYHQVLVGMLEFAPNKDGQERVARSIVDCEDNTVLLDLGKYYIDNLLKPSKWYYRCGSIILKMLRDFQCELKEAKDRDRHMFPLSKHLYI
jgi:hypothetical protein